MARRPSAESTGTFELLRLPNLRQCLLGHEVLEIPAATADVDLELAGFPPRMRARQEIRCVTATGGYERHADIRAAALVAFSLAFHTAPILARELVGTAPRPAFCDQVTKGGPH